MVPICKEELFSLQKGWKWCLEGTKIVPLVKEEPFSKKRLEMVPLKKKRYYFGLPEAPFSDKKKVRNGLSLKKWHCFGASWI